MRKVVLPALTALVLSATANAAVAQDARKICTERYDTEKASGTIPVGMSKSTYMNQCTGSIRRAAKLERELAQGGGEPAADQSGSNEVTVSTAPAKPVPITNKPARVPTVPGPKGS